MSQEVSGKANANHTHTTSQISDIGQASVNYANSSGSANSAGSVPWSGVSGKPSSYTPSDHTHPASQITDLGNASVNYANSANYANAAGYITWPQIDQIPANVNNAINRNGDTMHGDLTMVTGRLVGWQSEARVYSPSAQHLYLCGSGDGNYFCHVGVHDGQWTFDPDANGMVALGTGNHRWTQVYANSGAISTSDRNQKNTIQPLDDRYIQLFLKLLPVSFKFNNGTSGRTHIGFISQDVEAAMQEVGLSDLEFAGFCRDQKTVPVQKTTKVKTMNEKTGKEEWQEITYTEDEPVEGEYVYSLRYEEFIALNTAVIQGLIKRVELLENKLNSNQVAQQ